MFGDILTLHFVTDRQYKYILHVTEKIEKQKISAFHNWTGAENALQPSYWHDSGIVFANWQTKMVVHVHG